MELNLELFGKKLEEEVLAFSYLSCATISGLIWEERIVNSLIALGLEPKWKMGSHRSGADIEIGDYKFSAKTQKIKKDFFELSSFRMTKFKTLEEKIDFIDNSGKNFTHYLILSQEETEDKIIYRIYLIDDDFVKASNFVWHECFGKTKRTAGKNMGWETEYKDGMWLRISRDMSDQLWIYVERKQLEANNKVKVLSMVEIKKNIIGNSWFFIKQYTMENLMKKYSSNIINDHLERNSQNIKQIEFNIIDTLRNNNLEKEFLEYVNTYSGNKFSKMEDIGNFIINCVCDLFETRNKKFNELSNKVYKLIGNKNN